MFSSFNNAFLSLLGGVIPALFWLWFWLKEDRLHPEPRSRISIVFILGMLSVFLVLPVERYIFEQLHGVSNLTIILWAITEEIFKFAAFYLGAMMTKDVDEPIDPVIYAITAALGFSALENSLFLSNLINTSAFAQSIITGSSRFIGATLLHIISSASVGVMIGLSFYKGKKVRFFLLLTGLFISIILHTIFNLLIIRSNDELFFIFSGVWAVVIMIIVIMEKIKSIKT